MTEKRRQKIRSTCQTLLAARTPSLHELASCIGSLATALPGVLPAPLHMRALQAIQGQAVRREQAWTSPVVLTPEAEEDLRWWISHLDRWNGRPLQVEAPMMLIRSAAATDDRGGEGWGAVCGSQATGGHWSREEQTWHINALELQAAKLAVQSFAKAGVRGRIALQLDNQVAVSYINRMGGTHSPRLDRIARELWEWCLTRETTVEAEYLPGPKHRRRFPVQTPRLGRVAAPSGHFPAAATLLPSQLNRPVRDQNQRPAFSLRVLAARATVRRYRRLHSRLAARKGLRLSPFALLGRVIRQVERQEVPSLVLVTPMCRAAAWSASVGSDRGPAVSSSGTSGPSPRPSGSSSPAGPSGTAVPLRVAHLRSVHAAAGLPQSVSELLVASLRPGTSRRYNSVWAVWRSWCRGQAVDPVSPLLRDVQTFLAETFTQDRSYWTIGGYRSALSSALPPINGVAVGAHPTVCRLLKGAYNTQPPRLRYATTWDVGGVLSHLRSWGASAQQSDRRLTLRLAMLLALAGARRSGELASMGRPRVYGPTSSLSRQRASPFRCYRQRRHNTVESRCDSVATLSSTTSCCARWHTCVCTRRVRLLGIQSLQLISCCLSAGLTSPSHRQQWRGGCGPFSLRLAWM